MLDAFSVSQLVVEEGITAIGPEGATVYSIADSETNTIYLPDSLTAENFSCKGASNLCEIRLPAGMHTLRDASVLRANTTLSAIDRILLLGASLYAP